MVSACVQEALYRLLPRDTRYSRRVGVEQFGFFLLVKWLDKQEPGLFLAATDPKFQWDHWRRNPELNTAERLGKFIEIELLTELRCRAKQDPSKPLAPLFAQANLLHCVFGADALQALALIDQLDLSQDAVRRACAAAFLPELDHVGQQERIAAPPVPTAICDLAAQLANVKQGAVLYDPACVTGVFLGGTAAQLRARGVQPAALYADTTESRALVATVVAVLESGTAFRSRLLQPTRGRSYDEHAYRQPQCQADFVVANPPFGYGRHQVTGQRTTADHLDPVRLEGDFLLRGLAALKPGGAQMAAILPDGWLSSTRRSVVRLRTRVLDEYRLWCVISLPRGVFPGSTAKTSLLLLERPGVTGAEILYCEMPRDAVEDSARAYDRRQAVADLCHQWRSGRLPDTDRDVVTWWTVQADACRADRYALVPRQPQTPASAPCFEPPAAVIQRLLSSTRQLDASVRSLARLLTAEEEACL